MNVTGTLNLLEAARWGGQKRFVFISSAAVYGEPKYLPMDERHPTEPENYYGFTKLEIERILAIRHQTQQVVEDALLPPGHEEVVGLDISLPRLGDQVAIFDLAKDQVLLRS
mgnify:CR=1 FL=1